MTGINKPKESGDNEQRERRYWNIIQLQNTWIAVGIAVLGLGIAAATLSEKSWIAVTILLILGLLICVFSRQIASVIFKIESNNIQNTANTTRREVIMPNSLKTLATIAAWVFFVLGCICFICGIANLILISFNVISITSPVTIQLVYVGFGILCFALAFIAARIRGKIE